MKSVVAVSSRIVDLNLLSRNYAALGTVTLSPARLVVEGSFGWFAFDLTPGLEDDFDDEEMNFVRDQIATPHFALIEFSTEQAVNEAILNLHEDELVLLDNDHGLFLSADDARARIRRGEAWHNATA